MPGAEFLVEIPPQWRSEREYALTVLLADWLGVAYSVHVREDLAETRIRMAAEPGDVTIAIPDALLARSTEWLSPGSLPPVHLPTIHVPTWTEFEGELPVLYGSVERSNGLVTRDGSRFVLNLDLLGSLLFMLTGYEARVEPRRRDEHGRFPANASALGSAGWLQWPVLDMYLHVFVSLVRLAWPRVKLAPRHGPGMIIGHDVDHPSSSMRWHGRERLRKLGGDLLVRHDPGLALGRASSFLPRAGAVSRLDPYNTYSFLMQASELAGIRSTFFFLTKDTDVPYGSRYRLDDRWAGLLMGEIAGRGHHIGLHGSYNSSTDGKRLREEWNLLEGTCRRLPQGTLRRTVRQHYLRQQPGDTWRAQVEAGLDEDESLGFADAIGYRAGTARSFQAYDLDNHCPLPLRIKPLHVMDVTLLGYMSLQDADAVSMVAAMASRTRAFGGDFSLLWHNSSLETHRSRERYREVLASITTQLGPVHG